MGLIRATGRMSRNFSLIRLASIILFIPILFYLIYYTSSSSKTSFNSFKHPVFQEKDLTISSTLTDKIDLSSTKLRIMSVIGTRPETIKMFPVIKQLEKRQGVSSFVLVSGQHDEMVTPLLKTFDIYQDINLNVMVHNQTLTELSERLVNKIGKAIALIKPDWILVQGDTTTAFIASLIAFYHKIPVAHIEAGLRTYSRYSPFPEEINRRLTGTLGALHFTPTNTSAKNLLLENISESKIIITGNTVIDSLLWMSNQPPTDSASSLMERLYFGVSDRKSVRLILVTAHRRENWGAPLENICRAVERISKSFPDVRILFPMHLNPLVQNTAKSILGKNENIILSNPLEYDIFAFVMKSIYLVMTDSGGIQEEATAFSVPILVLRKSTERPEGVDAGMAKLIGTDEDVVVKEATLMLSDISMYGKMVKKNSPYGDGHASEKIVDKILATDGKKITEDLMIRNVTPGLEVTPQSKSGNQNTHEKDMDKIFEIATPPKFPIVSIKRSIQELMAMKSAYPDNGDGKELNGITAIIASYKRPKVVVRIFDALLAQTVKPTEIWVSVFSSPHEEEYRKIIQDYKLTHEKDSLPPIHFISGGPQFTYFARFQLALLAKTKYVALFDDDVIPVGKNVFHNMLHTINLPNQEYFGMFGCKGHVSLPQPDPKNFAHAHYTSTFTHEPSKIEEADIVGGLWFVRKEWIKFMFIEDPITIASGEDIHLTAMLSKYGNIPTYLFPIDPKDTDSFLHSADFIEVSTNEATTGNGDKIYNGAGWDVHALRNAISWWLLNRGQVRPLAVQMYAPTHNIVYFFDTESQAKALGPLATYLNNPKNSGTKVKAFRPMYCYSSRDSTTDSKRQELIEKYQTILNFKSDWNNLATGLWMLELGRTKTGREQGKDWMARVIYAFHPTLANTQPIAVVFSSSEVNEVVLAAAMVALEFGSPVIVFDEEEKVENNNLLTESAKRKMIKMKRVLIEMADFVGKSHMEITNYCDAIVKKIST